jgi:hypothetical protein
MRGERGARRIALGGLLRTHACQSTKWRQTAKAELADQSALMRELSFLNQLRELVGGQLAIAKNVKKPGSDRLARVHRYHRASAILVAREIMAAFDAENRKARLSESGNEIGSGDAGLRLMPRWSRAEFPRTPNHVPARLRLPGIILSPRECAR